MKNPFLSIFACIYAKNAPTEFLSSVARLSISENTAKNVKDAFFGSKAAFHPLHFLEKGFQLLHKT